MIEYILKFSGCLLVLYLFYRVFLENEKLHLLKRYFLLFSLLAAIILPLSTITYNYDVEAVEAVNFQNFTPVPYSMNQGQEVQMNEVTWKEYLPFILWVIYSVGVVCFLYRFLKNLLYFKRLIETNDKVVEGISTKVLLPFRQIPYSYFRYIFVEKNAFRRNQIPKEILKHEEAHVKQNHTLDLLILEILQIIFWFNPLFYFIKRSIRLNHEFMADEAVLKQKNIIPAEYLNLLINSTYGINQNSMTSSFKSSLIKKRIVMISNSFSKKRAGLKIGFIVPVLCGCIYFFNNDIVANPIPINDKGLNDAKYLEDSKTDSLIDADSIVYGRINYLNLSGKDDKGLKIITNRWAIENKKNKILGDKKLEISIEGQNIKVNGKPVHVQQFVQAINSTTHKWTEQDKMLYTLSISFDNKEKPTFYELSKRFQETDIFKSDPTHGMVIYEAKAEDVIQEIMNVGGYFYLNDQRISAEKASELLKDPNAYNYIKSFDENGNKMALNIWYNQVKKQEETDEKQFMEDDDQNEKVLLIGITTGFPPSDAQMEIWKNKKNIKFFWDNKPVTKSQLNSFDLNTIRVSKEYEKELETVVYLETTYTQYFKMSPNSLDLYEGNQSYGISKIFVDNKPVSKKELEKYSPNDIQEMWFVQDGKLPADEDAIWRLFTKPVDAVHASRERVVQPENRFKRGDQDAKIHRNKQIIKQIRETMVNSINELIEKGDDVTYFEDGKEITASKALNLAKEVEIGKKDMILTTITGSKTPVIWANLRSLVIKSDMSFSLKYEEEYHGRTPFE